MWVLGTPITQRTGYLTATKIGWKPRPEWGRWPTRKLLIRAYCLQAEGLPETQPMPDHWFRHQWRCYHVNLGMVAALNVPDSKPAA